MENGWGRGRLGEVCKDLRKGREKAEKRVWERLVGDWKGFRRRLGGTEGEGEERGKFLQTKTLNSFYSKRLEIYKLTK